MEISILHVITGLSHGGAEAVLYRLCTSKQTDVTHQVISLMDLGKYGPLLQNDGINVKVLDNTKSITALFSIFRLTKMIRTSNPDIVQTWMYHANLIGGVAAKLAGCKNIVWSIRHTKLEHNKKSTQFVSWLCGKLSKLIPVAIVGCSESAADIHKQYGYAPKKMSVIPNGYDLENYSPSKELGSTIRSELGIASDALIFGMVGRWTPEKDHKTLLESLAIMKKQAYNFICLLVGSEVDEKNTVLAKLIKQNGLQNNVRLLGHRTDITAIMNTLDLHILSSATEAFPNVVAEAMACGTPCVTTDVGDASMIVGNPDWVVPPKRPDLLAEAIGRAISTIQSKGLDVLGMRCRQRIVDNFSLDRMVQSYMNLWKSLMAD